VNGIRGGVTLTVRNSALDYYAASHGARNPRLDDADWDDWRSVTGERNALCKGARVLAVASIEALTNEVMSLQFREMYEEMERQKRARPLAS
jgi:hypothetical protein